MRSPLPDQTAGIEGSAVPDATQAKLLEAAGQVFSELGFHAATVREICARAGANVAAVNYHFGDKLELYVAVLKYSMCLAQPEVLRELMAEDVPPEEKIPRFVRLMLRKMHGVERPAWYFKIMAHEMAHPTPALGRIVEEILQPNYSRFSELVGRALGLPAAHETTRLCVHSIVGQVLHYGHGRAVLAHLWPELQMTPERIDQVADHIAQFSLAGLAAVRGRVAEHRAPQRKNESRRRSK